MKERPTATRGASHTRRVRRVGVLGTFVWDVIHPWPPHDDHTEGWGGIAYALSALDAALTDGWEIVPVIKVGSDLADEAREFLGELRRPAPDARLQVAAAPNNRSELRYVTPEQRVERLSGRTPGWDWNELGPLVNEAALDALYVNFLSGWELDLPTARALRDAFVGPIHADLHMLLQLPTESGRRELRPLADAAEWYRAFDFVQVNEEEMAALAPDAATFAAAASAAGVLCTVVTLGSAGSVAYPVSGFDALHDRERLRRSASDRGSPGAIVVPPAPVPRLSGHDPTGCGDVWGATFFARLLVGDVIAAALSAAAVAAARNVVHRGASGLAAHLAAGPAGDTPPTAPPAGAADRAGSGGGASR